MVRCPSRGGGGGGGDLFSFSWNNISVFQMFNIYILYDVAHSVPYIPVIFPYVLSTCKILILYSYMLIHATEINDTVK